MGAKVRVCATCSTTLPPLGAADAIAGDLCGDCLHHLQAQMGVPLRDYLDRLGLPVLVVDGDIKVSMANTPALSMLGKTAKQVRGHRGGDVFECANARLPGGCGQTVHCSGCAIRHAVTETFMTGKSFKNVPAYLARDLATQFLQLGMLISTEKVWDMVWLRIDHIGSTQPPRQAGAMA